MKRLNNFFFALMIIGGIPMVLAFFDIGRSFYDNYRWWFLGLLWTGVIGNWITERKIKKQRTAHTCLS